MTKTITPVRRLATLPPRDASFAAARELLGHVRAIGGDVAALIRRAKVQDLAERLADDDGAGPMPRDDFARLYAECTWVLDAHECLREGRMPLTKGEVDLLCYCVITCRDLREVVGRTIDFTAMLMPRMSKLTMEVQGKDAVFQMQTIRSLRGPSGFVSDITGLGMFYRLFSWLIGRDIRPLRAGLCYPEFISAQTAARMLPCPIDYGVEVNHLVFPSGFLDRPVVRSYAELRLFLKNFPFDPDAHFSATATLADRVEQIYSAQLAEGRRLSTTTDLARELGISPATLRRRLADEESGLSAIKAQCRSRLAEQLIRHGQAPLEHIAVQCGFTDVAAFSRAFQRWQGAPLGRWRRENSGAE